MLIYKEFFPPDNDCLHLYANFFRKTNTSLTLSTPGEMWKNFDHLGGHLTSLKFAPPSVLHFIN